MYRSVHFTTDYLPGHSRLVERYSVQIAVRKKNGGNNVAQMVVMSFLEGVC